MLNFIAIDIKYSSYLDSFLIFCMRAKLSAIKTGKVLHIKCVAANKSSSYCKPCITTNQKKIFFQDKDTSY